MFVSYFVPKNIGFILFILVYTTYLTKKPLWLMNDFANVNVIIFIEIKSH